MTGPKPNILLPLHTEHSLLPPGSSRSCAGAPPSTKQVRFSSPASVIHGEVFPLSPQPAILQQSPVLSIHSASSSLQATSIFQYPHNPDLPVQPIIEDRLMDLQPPIAALTVPMSSPPPSNEFEEEIDQLASSFVESSAGHNLEASVNKPMKLLGTYLDKFKETARKTELSLIMEAPNPRARTKVDLGVRQSRSSLRHPDTQSTLPPRSSRPLTSLSFTPSMKSDRGSQRALTDHSKRIKPNASSRNLSALGTLSAVDPRELGGQTQPIDFNALAHTFV
jgi:hypothetical protein